MVIWKYPLGIVRHNILIMPAGAKILSIPVGAKILALQVQYQCPCIWALVDETAPLIDRSFHTYGTGQDMPDEPGEYVGTYQTAGGGFVFHVFEK